MKKLGQNSLLVATTLSPDRYEASSRLRVIHKGYRTSEALRLLLSKYVLFGKRILPSEDKEAINLLYSEILHFIELKMIKINDMQKHALLTLIKEINVDSQGLTNNYFLEILKGIFLYHNKFEFFGRLKNKVQTFSIRMTLRKKRQHSERYIGVGYKDKGNAKVESWDGFHSWQEITATGKARLNENIRANSFRIKSLPQKQLFKQLSLVFGQNAFGIPLKLHLEQIQLGPDLTGWRELFPLPQFREEYLEIVYHSKSVIKEFIPSIDSTGRYIYLDRKVQ